MMNDGPPQSKINQTFERLNCMVNIDIIAHPEKIVCVCFLYDLLVVMNVIEQSFGSC
jgi:hypothetical protein